jgi:glycosyltransferase involved in cell wall biosynthesis
VKAVNSVTPLRPRIDIWHNILWSKYKGAVFSELYKLAVPFGIELRFHQVAESEVDRLDLSPVDLRYHRYPYHLLFAGAYSRIPRQNLYRTIARFAISTDADLTIIMGYSTIECWIHAFIMVLRRKKFLVFCDSTIFDQKQTFIKTILKRLFFSFCSGVLCYGHRSGEYVRFLGVPSQKIYLGCQAAAEVQGYDPKIIPARRQSARSQNARYLYVGRLSSEKRIVDLLHAFANVIRSRPDSRLIIIGAGPEDNSLHVLARNLGVQSTVEFAGALFGKALEAEYLKASCLILPSGSEPWGLVVNEALSYGCPAIVSSRCGCIPELVVDGQTGFVFDCYDVQDLEQKMLRLQNEFTDLTAVAERCLAQIAPFTPAAAATSILTAIQEQIT